MSCLGHYPRLGSLALTTGLLADTGAVQAQDALLSSLTQQRASTRAQTQLENAPYTVRWGDLRTVLGASLGLEWNDNIRLEENSPRSDFILRPQVSVNSMYPVGQFNVLRLYVTAGYDKYFEHDEEDRWNVAPGSELSFDVFVKDLRINFHERASYSVNATQYGAVSGQGNYGGFENVAGVLFSLPMKDVTTSLGYDYLRFISASDSPSEQMDRGSHNVVGRVGMSAHPAVTVGLEGSGGYTEYDEAILNDNMSVSGGPYVQWQPSEYIDVEARGGYVYYTFLSGSPYGTPGDYSSYYALLRLRHRLNEWFSYSLDGGRSSSLGVNANLSETWDANLQAQFRLIRNVSLSARAFYENGEEFSGYLPQVFDRFGVGVSLGYTLLPKLTTTLAYDFLVKDSDLANYDYTQNRVSLTLGYRF